MPSPSPALQSGDRIALLSASATELDPRPRALYIAASGTIGITNSVGAEVASIPVFAGTVLPLQPFKITTITTAVVYGIY